MHLGYAEGHKEADRSVVAWRRRKETYLAHLRECLDAGILRVSSADKLHNARAILSDYQAIGHDFWSRFGKKTKRDQLWYYESLADIYSERAAALRDRNNARIAHELSAVVERIGSLNPVAAA